MREGEVGRAVYSPGRRVPGMSSATGPLCNASRAATAIPSAVLPGTKPAALANREIPSFILLCLLQNALLCHYTPFLPPVLTGTAELG